MCGRYVISSEIKTIEKRFNISLEANFKIEPNYNIAPGQFAPVILNKDPRKLELCRFGYTPAWSDKGRLTINARVDNKESNPNDAMDYFDKGGKPGIYQHKYWRTVIRNNRCIIIADAFYEGPKAEKLDKPYLVHMRNRQKPFAMAGVWDTYSDKEGREQIGFAILTVPANALLHKIGHHRSPVIIPNHSIQKYLTEDLSGITSFLKPYDASLMNAYPVSSKMKSWKENSKELVNPTGERVMPEFEDIIVEKITLEGMGTKKKRE